MQNFLNLGPSGGEFQRKLPIPIRNSACDLSAFVLLMYFTIILVQSKTERNKFMTFRHHSYDYNMPYSCKSMSNSMID